MLKSFITSTACRDMNKMISSRQKIRSSLQNIFITLDSHIWNQETTNNPQTYIKNTFK